MEIDRDAVLGRDVREQQKKRVIGRRVLVRSPAREMLRRHLAEPHDAVAQELLRPILERLPNVRTGVVRRHRLLNHRVQRPAATENGERVRMLFHKRQDAFDVEMSLVLERVWRRLKEDLRGILAPEPVERRTDRAFEIVLVEVRVRLDVRRKGRHRRRRG
ncbi:MAG: hypothetical protein A3F69_05165 [Acidobacteria bacterium RIFCSPLOWO2_12_FULL_66_10]|nr:MAG: hypothetical protein A3F69_05165 [Acidobacteria bacterium RIFCSPLOWO2_12_FULL_66_10]